VVGISSQPFSRSASRRSSEDGPGGGRYARSRVCDDFDRFEQKRRERERERERERS
jgi:hypothetical protein